MKHLNRAATGRLPRGRTLPPIISEFAYTSEATTFTPSEDLKLLRQYHKRDANGSQHNYLTFSPKEFLECAKECKHPINTLLNVDDITKRALYNILTLGPQGISEKRSNTLQELTIRVQQLDLEEHKLHESMPTMLSVL
jgi:hypothetical protein